ncbi:hypothetical protein ASG65_01415 [Bacillus sp. Leaf13]|nr:hypothetical protein ASG65_01415 [Bacillus sp. Leaf13]
MTKNITEKVILDELLPLYEKSRVWDNMEFEVRHNFNGYDLDNGVIVDSSLVFLGIIGIKQKDIHLNKEKVYSAYRKINRDMTEEEITFISNYLDGMVKVISTDWVTKFINDCKESIKKSKKVPYSLGAGFPMLEKIIKTLHGIDSMGEKVFSERVFSKKILGDSKIFEREIRNRIITIIKKYNPVLFNIDSEILDDEYVLSEVGLIKSTGELIIKGDLKIKLDDKILDYEPFVNGALLDVNTIVNGNINELSPENILIVENKAVFYETIRIFNENVVHHLGLKDLKTPLFIYLGGFPGHFKRTFLRKIEKFLKEKHKNPTIYFWGDIDYGGIQIYLHLKENIFSNIKTFNMNTKVLEKCKDELIDFETNYKKKLKLLSGGKDVDINELVEYMINNTCRLEQEALIYLE